MCDSLESVEYAVPLEGGIKMMEDLRMSLLS